MQYMAVKRFVSTAPDAGRQTAIRLGNQPAFSASNNRFETSATCLDCCLSHSICDGVKGWFTMENLGFELGEAVEAMSDAFSPKDVEG